MEMESSLRMVRFLSSIGYGETLIAIQEKISQFSHGLSNQISQRICDVTFLDQFCKKKSEALRVRWTIDCKNGAFDIFLEVETREEHKCRLSGTYAQKKLMKGHRTLNHFITNHYLGAQSSNGSAIYRKENPTSQVSLLSKTMKFKIEKMIKRCDHSNRHEEDPTF
ncbi:hypothetical protein C5167_023264 [Papaver somniferum]|uniref:Uncharacterized protein n=1 Tax=Papaver somniferum TaxID=3469 RepID=A0A4Y7JN86_PAPSO|nr:hypothetical protein C5167_023264 [Papaver somniferum]